MSSNASNPGWIDFKSVKATADVDVIVEGLGLDDTLEKKGEEWVGFCPFHPDKGKSDSFHISAEKKAFHCFSCKRKGSVLDFVHLLITFRGEAIDLRMAADWIQTHMEQAEGRRQRYHRGERDRQDLGERDAREIANSATQSPSIVDSSGLFVDFSEACRLVTFGKATVQDFVAIRTGQLMEVIESLSPLKQATKIDRSLQRR